MLLEERLALGEGAEAYLIEIGEIGILPPYLRERVLDFLAGGAGEMEPVGLEEARELVSALLFAELPEELHKVHLALREIGREMTAQ